MKIHPTIAGVTGDFDMDTDRLVCVGSRKHGRVSLCFEGSGMHVPFAEIELCDSGLAKDTDATFDDAYALGLAIAARWNTRTGELKWLAGMGASHASPG